MDLKQYLNMGTSVKRHEKRSDHKNLRIMLDKDWKGIRDFCKQPHEQIREWQFKKIKNLVKYAFNNVSLYKEKYSAIGFKPEDLKTWGDFEALPILSKKELIAGFPDKSVSRKHNLEFTTRSSGSSGKFVTIAVSRAAIYLDTIQGARQFYFQSGGNYTAKDLAVFIGTCPWWTSSIDGDYPTKFIPTTTNIENAEKIILDSRPKVLSLYPSYLSKFLEGGKKLKNSGLDLIVTHSEQSTLKQRIELSNFFGVPVLDEFSSEELTRIALECPEREYHLEEDACYTEIIDLKTKKKVSNGKRGLIAGTNLLNYATPIIRYSQDDITSIKGEQNCGCKSNFRIMNQPEGRYADSIITKDGSLIPSGCFMDIAYNWYLENNIPLHGLRYQIVQDKEGDLDIFLIKGAYNISNNQKMKMKESFYQLIPKNMKIKVHFGERAPITGGLKYQPIISLVERK